MKLDQALISEVRLASDLFFFVVVWIVLNIFPSILSTLYLLAVAIHSLSYRTSLHLFWWCSISLFYVDALLKRDDNVQIQQFMELILTFFTGRTTGNECWIIMSPKVMHSWANDAKQYDFALKPQLVRIYQFSFFLFFPFRVDTFHLLSRTPDMPDHTHAQHQGWSDVLHRN